jgi:lipopolysaccharide/colanic/teichoic acid biosynthesis glycosyltransferase
MMSATLASRVKRLLDLVLCLATLPLSMPLMALIAVLVKLGGRGRVLYRARRVGRGGAEFNMLKFRTMAPGCGGLPVTCSGDPRVTRVGKWLRASKLDELPQIFNVIRGEMSLVGPRPEDPLYVAAYTPEQRLVLSVRPGMANSAFLRFGHELKYIERVAPDDLDRFYRAELLPQTLDLELRYVRGWTLTGDLRILVQTLAGLLPGRR